MSMCCRGASYLMQRWCKPSAERQTCLFVMSRCQLSYAKLLKISGITSNNGRN